MTIQHPGNVKTAPMIDRYNNEIGHRLHRISIQTETIPSRIIIEIIIGISLLKGTTISPALDEMTINSITGEGILGHHLLTATGISNMIITINKDISLTLITQTTDKVTIVEAATEEVRHEEACNHFVEHLGMIRAVIEHAKEHKKL